MFVCGWNDDGQLGLGDEEERNTFTAVPALPDGRVAKQVIAGSSHTMILAEDGTVFACGRNYEGQLGLGDNYDRNTFTAVPALPDGKVAKQVVAGGSHTGHTMILAEDGTVFACGMNDSGRLGLGDEEERNTFTAVSALPDGKIAKQVIAGSSHTMILAEDGTVFACGGNEEGQLGLGDDDNRNTFTAVPDLPDGKVAKQVVAGAHHTMILAEDGTVFACGSNDSWQLGLGDDDDKNTFTAVPDLPDGKVAKQVVVGFFHTMILAEDGTVFACGRNGAGQLGLGDDDDFRFTFTAVPALPDGKVAKQVIAGGFHTMILAQDGTVFGCGDNDTGQLGLGDTNNRNTFTAVPFFGPDHPGLVPILGRGIFTFAGPAPLNDEEDAPAAAPTSPLQADLMALVDGNDDVLHCDVTLVGSDGVSLEAHSALLHARCPKLFQQQHHQSFSSSFSSSSSSSSSSTTHSSKRSRLSPSGIASPMLSPPAKAGDDNDDAGIASITVGDATSRALSGVVRFLYSDTLPAFDEMDEQKKKHSSKSKSKIESSSSNSISSSEVLPSGLDAAFELMIVARALSSADAPAMQHLQALCERHISKRLDLSNVVPLLAKAVDAQYAPLQRVCHEYLAEKKPTSADLSFAPKLITALVSNPAALATAVSAAGGSLATATSIYAPTEIPSQRLPDAMASLWRRADAAAAQQMHQQDEESSSSSSKSKKGKSKKGKSKKGKSKKKRSSDDAGNDDHDDQASPFGPDITVSIGSGEGATSLRADRFVLASRSDYFRACLDQRSFQEGAAGRVTLDVPSPQPSAAASRAVLEFLYTGSLSHEGSGGGGGSASLSSSSSSSSSASLTPNDALDVLHVTGHSDEGGGYLQLRDNKRLRSQARSVIAAGLDDGSAFSLLRRSSAMNQEEAKGPIMEHLLKARCGARPTDGQAARDNNEEEDGAWAPSEEWWSKDREIAMCHEVIDELMSSR